jgi:reverse gyrase
VSAVTFVKTEKKKTEKKKTEKEKKRKKRKKEKEKKERDKLTLVWSSKTNIPLTPTPRILDTLFFFSLRCWRVW